MRIELFNYIKGLKLGTFKLSEELPWDNNGSPLYHSNMKTIYVAAPEIKQGPILDTLNGGGLIEEITTVRVFFVCDAKQLPSNYETLVEDIKNGRLILTVQGVIQRLCQVITSFEVDRLVTEFEFSLRKVLTN